jgi:hypothetical protein
MPVDNIENFLFHWMPTVQFDEDVVVHRFPNEDALASGREIE